MQKEKSILNSTMAEGNENLGQLITRYVSRWPMFAAAMVITFSAAFIFLRYTIPAYESTASILIKDDNKGVDDSKILASLDLFSSKKIVENEIEVLRSRLLMKDVVKRLCLYAPVFREGKVHALSAFTNSPVQIEVMDPDKLIEQKKILFKYDGATKLVKINNDSYPLNTWITTPYGNLRFTLNKYFAVGEDDNSFYFSLVKVKKIVTNLLEKLEVAPSTRLSTVVNLKIKDAVPERGEAILNELLGLYNASVIKEINALAANALSFVEERLHYVLSDLDSVENALQQFKANRGVVDISEQGKLYLKGVETTDQRLSEINVQLAVLDELEQYVKSKDHVSGIVPSSMGVNDPLLAQLLETLYNTELQYEKLKKTTAENNPILISLSNQIEKIKPSVLENVVNQRHNLEATKRNLSGTSGEYSSLLRKIPEKEKELLAITRQQSIKNNIYTFLLQKREEAALSFAGAVADSKAIDNAESTVTPVTPKKSLVFAIALLLSLSIPFGFITLKHLLDETVQFKSDIRNHGAFPVIGEISYASFKNPIVISHDERTFVAEQFRHLRTSLNYVDLHAKHKIIVVTSSMIGEGKTFIASNLATSIGLAGKKVVLVELDLRKPSMSDIFQVQNSPGISEYLVGDVSLENLMKNAPFSQNITLLPAGNVPKNPSELILGERFEQMINNLKNHFEYIIIETAPVNEVTDAYIVSNISDLTIYVVRQGLTPKASLVDLQENTSIVKLKNIAIVFNGVRKAGINKKKYGYATGYGGKAAPVRKAL